MSHGLKYAPPHQLNKFETFIDVNKFIRKMNIKRHFILNPIGNGTQVIHRIPPSSIRRSGVNSDDVPPTICAPIQHSNLRNASLFNPPGFVAPAIQVFKELVTKDLLSLKITKPRGVFPIQTNIKKICQRNEIVIRPADKGGGIVILDKSQYVEEMNRQLSDSSTYTPLPSNPTVKYRKLLSNLVDQGLHKGILNKKEHAHLIPITPRVPVIYYLPKLHKSLVKPPGRPIISGIDSVTARIGKYVDSFLQPLVKSTPAFLRDTTEVLNLLKEVQWKDGYILATADVASLYTVISHQHGLQAVDFYLQQESDIPPLQKEFILELLRFATTHNYFWFGGTFFLQICGVAMGAKFAPSLANLFMAHWEREAIDDQPPSQLRLWKRYIDDVLVIWEGDTTSLEEFFFKLNSNTRGISLQYDISTSHIHFLDLNIYVKEDKLITNTFFKETDRNAFIPVTSCHHSSWLAAVPKGQFQRIRRNCTDIKDFHEQAHVLKQRFLTKGYQEVLINETMRKVEQMDRESLLVKNSSKNPIPSEKFSWSLTTKYSNQHFSIKKILKKHWDILKSDKIIGSLIPDNPIVIFKGAPALRLKIAPNAIDPPRTMSFFQSLKGFFPCRRCNICKVNSFRERKCTNFQSTATGTIYDIDSFMTCSTKYVVYMIQCPCSKQYIGRTKRELHIRLSEHVGKIKSGFPKHNLSKHYDKFHGRQLKGTSFFAIDNIRPHWRGTNMVRAISRLETRWIFSMKSFIPFGLNVDWDINCFLNNS